ncbi:MAG: carbohydrate deacetylase [Armatimonadetes bacterium]|nr:carbohydrate deacetylase [Armatimonadota bacterium]
MKRLIVHADDFNLTPGVNQGILEAFRDGIVRSTSIMINLPGLEASLEALDEHPDLDVGLHVNLTMGSPLLPAGQVATLVRPDGTFHRRPGEVTPGMDPAEAEAEIRAQVARAEQVGLRLTHLDSHHHLHEHPEITRVLIAIARERGLALRAYDGSRARIREAGIPTPDHIVIEFYGEDAVNEENFLSVLQQLKNGTTELCCHPAVPDDRLKNLSSYAAPREQERKVYTSERVKAALQEHGVRLASFADLL